MKSIKTQGYMLQKRNRYKIPNTIHWPLGLSDMENLETMEDLYNIEFDEWHEKTRKLQIQRWRKIKTSA